MRARDGFGVLIAVTGPPAAGKTSLALPLARALELPLLSKDAVKEAMFEGLESPTPADRSWSRALSDTSYRVLLNLLEGVPEAVLDLNLPPEWAPRFQALDRSLVQVFCRCRQAELERRLVARATSRHAAHQDDVLLDEIRSQGVRGIAPAPLDAPLLEVDTEEPLDITPVVAWIRCRLPA